MLIPILKSYNGGSVDGGIGVSLRAPWFLAFICWRLPNLLWKLIGGVRIDWIPSAYSLALARVVLKWRVRCFSASTVHIKFNWGEDWIANRVGGSFIVDWLFELNLKYRGGVKVNCSRAAKKSEIGNLSSKCIANLVCYCEWKRCLLKLGLICRVGNGRTQYSKPNGWTWCAIVNGRDVYQVSVNWKWDTSRT